MNYNLFIAYDLNKYLAVTLLYETTGGLKIVKHRYELALPAIWGTR